jgi:phosphoglycolate phosphatase
MNPSSPAVRWRAAIVDLDGTLIDTLGDFEAALAAALASLGLPAVGLDFIARTVGKGSRHLLVRTLAEVGGDPAQLDALWLAYQREYLRVNGRHSSVYPGTFEGLALLRGQGLRLACLTNKPLAFAEPLLEAKRLRGCFGPVFGGDSFARTKPDPLGVLETCAALGASPAHTLVIGDSANDAAAARAAGCDVVLLAHGYNHGEPLDGLGALAILQRLDEIGPLLTAGPGWSPPAEAVRRAADP